MIRYDPYTDSFIDTDKLTETYTTDRTEPRLYTDAEGKHLLTPSEPITNADRIRQMTDEELAVWLFNSAIYHAGTTSPIPSCEEWLEWLKKEVDDG